MKYGAPATTGATKLKTVKRPGWKETNDRLGRQRILWPNTRKGRGEVMDDKDEAVKRIGARRFISIICNRIKRK